MGKVLIISYDLNPSLGSEAGAAFLWASSVPERFEISVYTQELHKKDLEKASFNITYVRDRGLISKILRKLKLYNLDYYHFTNSIKSVLLDQNYELIHFLTPAGIHSYFPYVNKINKPYIIGPAGGFLRLPKGFEEYNNVTSKIKELYYKVISKNKKWINYFEDADKILVGTSLVAKNLPNKCKSKIKILHDTVVDTELFNGTRTRKNDNRIIITYSGRLEVYKGCQILLKSFCKIINSGYENIELWFAGDGSQYKKLRKEIEVHNLSKSVQLLGKISQLKLREILNNSDIFCLPTLKEPGGTAILEAMSCRLPVITTNYGGPAMSVDPECGILIDPINVEDYIEKLSQALEKLISNKELRNSLGNKARNHVINSFSTISLTKRISEIYSEYIK